MAFKMKKSKMRPLTQSEWEFYAKGYGDASVGNRMAYSKKDTKKPTVMA